MSHQCRLRLRVVSSNNQPQSSPLHWRKRVKSPVNISAAESATGQRILAVHTRAIIDPNVAAKLSGKHGHTSFGLMATSDEARGNFSEEEKADQALLPGMEWFIDKNAYSVLFRLRRDIHDQSSIGLLATSYNFVEKHNQLAGFDCRLNVRSNCFLTFQILGTNSRRFFYEPDKDQSDYRTGNGLGYYGEFNQTGRHLNWQVTGQGLHG